jgi:segregation and condensation protein A
MTYNVHLDVFEGPLELLLYLIRKNDLEINDIRIAEITAEYLLYLDLMQKLNIDIACEFLIMASTLMQIKARSLLPSETEEYGEEDSTLEVQLKDRLLEYQKYKEVGKLLAYKIVENSQIYYRPAPAVSKQDFVLDITVYDLASSFFKTLKTLSGSVKEIVYQEIFIETKIREILKVLETRSYIFFSEILRIQKSKMELIVCFMAVLELV